MRRFEWLFLDRKIPLKRPAGETALRETFLGDRSEGDWWREARDSDSAEPEVSLERMDVLEAASAEGVSGAWWDCRRRWPRESEDLVEGEVEDFVRRREDLPGAREVNQFEGAGLFGGMAWQEVGGGEPGEARR